MQVSSVKEYFDSVPSRFVEKEAKGVTAVFQFELSGAQGGTYAVSVKDGTVSVSTTPVPEPTVVLKMDGEEYVKMANGKINGHWAVMTGKLKVTGNMMMAMKLNSILPPSK